MRTAGLGLNKQKNTQGYRRGSSGSGLLPPQALSYNCRDSDYHKLLTRGQRKQVTKAYSRLSYLNNYMPG